jgi:hypothetical protein
MSLAKFTTIKVSGTQVSKVTSITWSGRSWAEEDTTNHDASTPIKTTQVTIADNGKVSLVISPYTKGDTQHDLLRTLSGSGASATYVMQQANSGEIATFDGFVTSFSYETPVNGLLKAKVDIRVNGVMTLT